MGILPQNRTLGRILNFRRTTVLDPLIPFDWGLFDDNVYKLYFAVHQVPIVRKYDNTFEIYHFLERMKEKWPEFWGQNTSNLLNFKLNFSKVIVFIGFFFLHIQKEDKKCYQIDPNSIFQSHYRKKWQKFEKRQFSTKFSLNTDKTTNLTSLHKNTYFNLL